VRQPHQESEVLPDVEEIAWEYLGKSQNKSTLVATPRGMDKPLGWNEGTNPADSRAFFLEGAAWGVTV
jgi:hypothetical protein